MENFTHPSMLLITAYGQLNNIKFFYSVCALIGYLMILAANTLLIAVVIIQKSLHKPMYIFIVALAGNGVYGSTAFFPKLIVDLLSERQTVSYISCLTQVFCIHTYMGCELTILAVMALDRYVCICYPLRYHSIMTHSMVYYLVGAAWGYSIVLFTIHFTLTVRLPLCGNTITKIYCDNWSVVRLSCIDTSVNNIFGLFITAALIGLMPILIIYSYIEIFIECVHASRETRAKALQTCTPHLVSMMNFVADVLFEIFLHRFELKGLPQAVRIMMSIQFLVVAPLLNPMLYGLKMTEIRTELIKLTTRNKILIV
ncbi:olfactory receptor 51I2-like [Pleurodeles waltl]|uniref:olfactory receptor 51I2-like n=1 Tax=Pleurodeles waltl TaxID=8319 RepID=UPI0037097296